MADASTPDLKYDFLPWARRGLARAHQHNQLALSGVSALPVVTLGLKLSGAGGGVADQSSAPTINLKLLGPGDIIGIDPRIIVRTEPRSNNHDFEPNYLAVIEFDPPDFPWMFTPAKADANQRLMPWLVLLVFKRTEVPEPVLRPGRLLPSIVLPPGVALADLSEAWMWAHAQVLRDRPEQQIPDMLKDAATKNLSRLVCPRRLEADSSYFACVVPAFKAGRDAGLGVPLSAGVKLDPAWTGTQSGADLELPVYFHWDFSTGPAGDFETLARRLKAPPEYPPGIQSQLDKLGRLPVEVDADRLLQPTAARAQGPAYVKSNYVAQYEGALLAMAINDSPEPGKAADIAADFATVLNAGEPLAQGTLGLDELDLTVPVVGPPIYGAWHARQHQVDAGKRDRWLNGLNASVPRRMAASVGTRLVQANQEVFMQAAWRQIGDVLKAERLFSLMHLSKKSLKALSMRLDKLPDARRLALLAPAASRVLLREHTTVWGYARSTSLPDGFADGALRRSLSPSRALLRRTAGQQAGALLPQLAAGFQGKESVKTFALPQRFRGDGLVSFKALDGVRLPTAANAKVTIAGFGDNLRVSDIRALKGQSGKAATLLKRGGWRDATVAQKLGAGVLLDSHYARIDELTATIAGSGALAATPAGKIAVTLAGTRKLRAEGVLLNVGADNRGTPLLSAQGLTVDARGGQLLAKNRALQMRGAATSKLNAIKVMPGAIGSVNVEAIRRYGNSALFNSLPANAVAQPVTGAAPVVIGSAGGGSFKTVSGAATLAGATSITVIPPITQELLLDRYKAGWRDKLVRDVVPAPPKGVSVDTVAFDTTATVKSAVAASDPLVLVQRRVESLLQLGTADFNLSKAPAGIFGNVLKNSERYVIPVTYDRVMAYPKINDYLYKRLINIEKAAFMPGVENIPNDTILLVKTNPKFVESFMVGVNHEMGRELLWRGYPTDQRGTPFRKFWQYFDPNRSDIQPIHLWNATSALGAAGGGDSAGRLALLVRGQLLRRYPNTHVYAVKKDVNTPKPDFSSPGKFVSPVGAGLIGNDIVFFLFDIVAADAKKHWFVLEEPMTEPRFGFDDEEQSREVPRVRSRGGVAVRATRDFKAGSSGLLTEVNTLRAARGMVALALPPAGDTWLDVDWSEVGTARGAHITLARLAQVDLADNTLEVRSAVSHAGEVARAILQRPFRGYFDGNRLS